MGGLFSPLLTLFCSHFQCSPKLHFKKRYYFLQGPSQWKFSRPLGRSRVLLHAQCFFMCLMHIHRNQLPRKLLCSESALRLLGLGASFPVRAEALTGSWHVLLPKPLLPWAQKDIYKIFQSTPEPLLPPKLTGLKTNPGVFLTHSFPVSVSTLQSCFLPFLSFYLLFVKWQRRFTRGLALDLWRKHPEIAKNSVKLQDMVRSRQPLWVLELQFTAPWLLDEIIFCLFIGCVWFDVRLHTKWGV